MALQNLFLLSPDDMECVFDGSSIQVVQRVGVDMVVDLDPFADLAKMAVDVQEQEKIEKIKLFMGIIPAGSRIKSEKKLIQICRGWHQRGLIE